MPIPKPNEGESKEDFISRCMGNETMKSEFPDNDQRLAVCYKQWRTKDEKSTGDDMERRFYPIEIREEKEGCFTGHAAVFNEYAPILWWDERVLPGAFTKALEKDDVRALFNHDRNYVLGRRNNKVKTLELMEDKRGLAFEITPADTSYARDLKILVERGDVDQCSFAFNVAKGGDKWIEGDGGERDKRDIIEVSRLYDISIVTFAAYDNTNVSVRSYEEWIKENKQREEEKYFSWKTSLSRKRLALKERRLV